MDEMRKRVVALEKGGQNRKDYARAVEYARKRMSLGALSPGDAQRLAAVAWSGGEHDLARQLIGQALARQPNSVDFLQLAVKSSGS